MSWMPDRGLSQAFGEQPLYCLGVFPGAELSQLRGAESENRIRGGSPPGLGFCGMTSSSSSPGAAKALWLPPLVEASGLLFILESTMCLISVYLHSFAESLVGLFDLGGKKVLILFLFILYSFAS